MLGASARRARLVACTSAPVGKLKANRSVVGEESAAATSVSATNLSLEKSTAASANVMTSPVPDTKASSAQVGTSFTVFFMSGLRSWSDGLNKNTHIMHTIWQNVNKPVEIFGLDGQMNYHHLMYQTG